MRVEYRTAWTGFCKPKHARTARVLAFVPAGAVSIPGQSIMVTVPPGAGPGQQLQVQTPQGIQTATIPPGVGGARAKLHPSAWTTGGANPSDSGSSASGVLKTLKSWTLFAES